MSGPEGTDALVRPAELGAVLAACLGDDAWRDLRPTLIAGGKSNLTYLLSSAAGELVLRRPPSGELLPSAHDMGREARVQRALAGSSVPVAAIRYEDADGDLLGVPFYVMDRVQGLILRDSLPDGYAEDEASRVALTDGLLDTLVAIHQVDPAAVGLADYGRPDGFLERQLRRWRGQWDASKTEDVADLDELGRLLGEHLPASQGAGLVHGDFRLDNCLMDPADPGRVAAVLDWEMSTLGDPLTDLGMLLFYWRHAGEPTPLLTPAPSQLAGFPSRGYLAQRYADATGTPLEDLVFYEAFAHFKFAVIAQGIAARAAAGAMAGQDFGDLDSEVRRVAADGLGVLATLH